MTEEAAQVLALEAFAWIMGDDEMMGLFLGSTGADISDLKVSAGDPAFLASVLDFLMMNDDWVRGFCDAGGRDYLAPMQARQMLPGGDLPNWT